MGIVARSFGVVCVLVGLAACSSSSGTDAGSPPGDTGIPTDGSGGDTGARDTGSGGDAPADTGPTMCGATLGACNPVTNAGCMPGQACRVTRNMAGTLSAACGPAGTGGWDAPCMTGDECREGFGCFGATATTQGRCSKLCCAGDNESCRDTTRGGRPGAVCSGGITDVDFRLCQTVSACDPQVTSANGCPTDRPYCNVIDEAGTTQCFGIVPVSADAGAGGGGEGAACCAVNNCQPGYTCVRPPMAPMMCNAMSPDGACRRVCNPMAAGADAGTSCPTGQMCRPFTNRPRTFGACFPAM